MNDEYKYIMIDGMDEYGGLNLNINKLIKELIKCQREGYNKVSIQCVTYDGEVSVYVTKP